MLSEPLPLAEHGAAAPTFIRLGQPGSAVAPPDLDLPKSIRSADRALERYHQVRHAVYTYNTSMLFARLA